MNGRQAAAATLTSRWTAKAGAAPATTTDEALMPDIYARPVDHPRGRVLRLHVTADEAARLAALLVGGLRDDGAGGLRCGPLAGEWVEVRFVGRRYRVRRAACGLPSCCCAWQYWPAGRRRPLPPPDWAHAETEDAEGNITGCLCGRLDELDRYWPRQVTR